MVRMYCVIINGTPGWELTPGEGSWTLVIFRINLTFSEGTLLSLLRSPYLEGISKAHTPL